MSIQEIITDLENALFDRALAVDQLKQYIKDHSMSGRQKAILFGWGESNYNHRMKQKINDHTLIECVKKLIEK